MYSFYAWRYQKRKKDRKLYIECWWNWALVLHWVWLLMLRDRHEMSCVLNDAVRVCTSVCECVCQMRMRVKKRQRNLRACVRCVCARECVFQLKKENEREMKKGGRYKFSLESSLCEQKRSHFSIAKLHTHPPRLPHTVPPPSPPPPPVLKRVWVWAWGRWKFRAKQVRWNRMGRNSSSSILQRDFLFFTGQTGIGCMKKFKSLKPMKLWLRTTGR